MTRLRVVWVVKAWSTGGAERMLLDLLPRLATDVDVIPVAALSRPDDLAPALERAGLRPRVLDGGPRAAGWRSRAGAASWPLRLRKLVRTERPDVVHTHGPLVGGLGRAGLLGAPVAVVHTEHSVWSSYRRPSRWLNALTFARNDGVAAVSAAVADEILGSRSGARTRQRLRVIRNGVDIATVRAEAIQCASVPEALRSPSYVCVGHLRHRKGIDVLLEAAVDIERAMPDARGFIVGDGEDAVALRAQPSALGLSTVTMMGLRDDARAIIARCDVFVVPSRVEGMPLALLEAMALERPIVATRVGGIPELLTHERDALLVPSEDPHALGAAIVRVLGDPALAARLAAAGRQVVEREADAATVAASYVDLYRAAIARRG
jgi:glycosyltransferase involved in cell wall biosynthesis